MESADEVGFFEAALDPWESWRWPGDGERRADIALVFCYCKGSWELCDSSSVSKRRARAWEWCGRSLFE